MFLKVSCDFSRCSKVFLKISEISKEFIWFSLSVFFFDSLMCIFLYGMVWYGMVSIQAWICECEYSWVVMCMIPYGMVCINKNINMRMWVWGCENVMMYYFSLLLPYHSSLQLSTCCLELVRDRCAEIFKFTSLLDGLEDENDRKTKKFKEIDDEDLKDRCTKLPSSSIPHSQCSPCVGRHHHVS